MKNKKGFSLVEILIVIAIIGILAGIIIPNVNRYLKNSRTNYNEKLSTELVSFTKNYYSENKNELPKGYLDTEGKRIYKTLIGASYLSSNNYITGEFNDSEGNDCTNSSYVIVTKDGDDYKYTPCIICGENNYTEKNNCNYTAPSTEGDMKDNILPRCTLKVSKGELNKWINYDVTLTLEAEDNTKLSYYYINSDTTGTGILFKDTNDTKKSETLNATERFDNYYVTVEDSSFNYSSCSLDGKILIDKVKPEVKSFKIASNNINYNASYTTVTVTAADDASGVDKVCITTSNDSSTCSWKDISDNTYVNNDYYVPSSNGSGNTDTLYAFVKDKAGNISSSKSASYTLYKYCNKTEQYDESAWGPCSKSCGIGSQSKTLYYRDKYFTSESCGTDTRTQECNTKDCSYSCYMITTALNCREEPCATCTWKNTFYSGAYHWYKYEKTSGGYDWYYDGTSGCYSAGYKYSNDRYYLTKVSDSYCSSGNSSGGGGTGGGSSSGGSSSCSYSCASGTRLVGSMCYPACTGEAICATKCKNNYALSGTGATASGYCLSGGTAATCS